MSDYLNLQDFLTPVRKDVISNDNGYNDGQIGSHINLYEEEFPDLDEADIVLVGIGEVRGQGIHTGYSDAPDKIREQFYQLYYWHSQVKMADIGNVKSGALLTDSYAAAKTVIAELIKEKKTVIILGGSHDNTLAQYYAYGSLNKIIEATGVDSVINLNMESSLRHESFLMEVLTGEPNYIRHYNHIGFQIYNIHPKMMETMDKLRFDCFRVGKVKEHIEEMEPVIRNSNLVTIDIAAIANAYAPATDISPNGFTGEEICTLTKYAGMSHNVNTLGIYGYLPEKDTNDLTAKQIAHMLWYFADGKQICKNEVQMENRDDFNEYHTALAEIETVFLQSKRTGRWWMQMPDKKFIACSYTDYVMASNNEIPERWLRAQERS
ncbi:MAG: arginase family protein [Sphingobacteriales bacterium]|nr:arginase family protein [Sphingobacteriales bacterium]